MKYRVIHRTKYSYSQKVTLCHNVAHLLPRTTPVQTCGISQLEISPLPVSVNEWSDLFGNRQASFSIQMPHNELIVTATSEVEVSSPGGLLDDAFPISWEQAVEYLKTATDTTSIDAKMYQFESEFIEFSDEVRQYTAKSFTPGRPLLQAVEDLMHRIYDEFDYVPGFSSIATPLSDVLEHRKGCSRARSM